MFPKTNKLKREPNTYGRIELLNSKFIQKSSRIAAVLRHPTVLSHPTIVMKMRVHHNTNPMITYPNTKNPMITYPKSILIRLPKFYLKILLKNSFPILKITFSSTSPNRLLFFPYSINKLLIFSLFF